MKIKPRLQVARLQEKTRESVNIAGVRKNKY